MASVTSQALLLQGANAVAARPGWHWPLSVVPDIPIWRDHSLFSDNAWLAAIQYTASVVPKSNTWQPPLSAPDYLKSRPLQPRVTDASSFTGNWLSSAGIVPAATPAFIGWQQELSVSRVTKHPIWADESSYDGVAWFQAATIVSPAAAFIARTSGLDATHINAYNALINGLVSDGIWSKLDVLHVYATQDSTTALLNLVSTSYNGTVHGLASFSVDLGYTGSDGDGSKYIDTGFNASTAVSPQYTRNSGHLSAWCVNNPSSGDPIIGVVSGSGESEVRPRLSNDGHFNFRINSTSLTDVAIATNTGHSLGNRSASNAVQGYRDGSSIVTGTASSVAVLNTNFDVIGSHNADSNTHSGSNHQVGMASIGSSLSAGDVTLFYNRLRTYMTAVGVP